MISPSKTLRKGKFNNLELLASPLPLFLSTSPCLIFCLSVFLSLFCLSASVSVSLSLCTSLCMSVCLSVCLSIYQSVCLSLSLTLSLSLSLSLSLCLPFPLSLCLPSTNLNVQRGLCPGPWPSVADAGHQDHILEGQPALGVREQSQLDWQLLAPTCTALGAQQLQVACREAESRQVVAILKTSGQHKLNAIIRPKRGF